jgi:glycosyltransferase involved in cell wall biosynthesis
MAIHYGIVIPVFNSARFLPELLAQIDRLRLDNIAVLVIDDGSDTAVEIPVANFQTPVKVIRHIDNFGKGAALLSGFEYFMSLPSVKAVITLDADLQHPPEKIPDFIRAFERCKGDLIVGQREREFGVMPIHRILSNWLTTSIISFLISKPAYDSQCGFRLYSRKVIERIRPAEKRFHMESEMLIRSGWAGFKIASIKIPTIYNGAPSAINNFSDTTAFVSLIFKMAFKRLRGNV